LAPDKEVSPSTGVGHYEGSQGEIAPPKPSPEQVYARTSSSFKVESLLSEQGLLFYESGKNEVRTSIQKFASDLERKIREVAQDEKVHGARDIEITAGTVIKANDNLRKREGSPRAQMQDIVLGILIPISSGAAGILGGNLTHGAWQAVLFGAATATAIFSTFVSLLKGRSTGG
jgi:hypothetical protein